MLRNKLFAVLLLGCLPSLAEAQGVFFTDDDSPHKPSLVTPEKPAKGSTYVDPEHDTTIRRVTDWVADGLASAPTIQYTPYTGENADGTMFAVDPGGTDRSISLYNATTYAYLRTITVGDPGSGDSDMEWRWDANDPNIGYYHVDAVWYQYDYSGNGGAGLATVMKDFSTYFGSGGWTAIIVAEFFDKGDMSWDSRYWALRGRTLEDVGSADEAQYLIFYDKTLDKVAKLELDQMMVYLGWPAGTEARPRLVTSSPSGQYAILWMSSPYNYVIKVLNPLYGGAGTDDMTVPNVNCSRFVSGGTNHMAWGYDKNGNEVFMSKKLSWYRMWRLSDNVETLLTQENPATWTGCSSCCPQPYGPVSECVGPGDPYTCCRDLGRGSCGIALNYHMSAGENFQGWVVLTSYGAVLDWLDSPGDGCVINNEVWAIELKNAPRILRLAQIRSDTGDYNSQSRAQVSRDGLRIYYDSNWLTGDSDDNDIYRLELPAGYWESLDEPSGVTGAAVSGIASGGAAMH